MWPFKSKEEQIRELNEQEKLAFEFKSRRTNSQAILDGDDPWDVDPVGWDFDNPKELRLLGWKITVFRFDTSSWDNILNCSEMMLGVKSEEFIRILKDKFGVVYKSIDYNGTYLFPTKESAQKAIEEFKPYYQSYYMPRAMIARLSNYSEDGYKPYFQDYIKKYGIVKMTIRNFKLIKGNFKKYA